jgi:hypothetical protein
MRSRSDKTDKPISRAHLAGKKYAVILEGALVLDINGLPR